MKRGDKIKKIILLLAASAVLLFGCGTATQTSNQTTTGAVEKATPTAEPTQMPDPTPVPKQMKSGSKADYKKYFKPEKDFDVKKDGVTYGEKVYIEYESKTTDSTRAAYVILPPGYSKDKSYPVLYILHGIGGNEDEWFSGSPVEIIGNLIAKKEVQPFITVVPNVRARKNDQDISDIYSSENIAAFDNFINDLKDDLMPFIKKNYSISERREDTAICGLSMGGKESLTIGFTMIDKFGYIGAFSPAPGLDVSLLSTENSDVTPRLVMICNGDSDSVVQDVPKTYHEELNHNKVSHEWYQVPGGDHNFDVWSDGLYNFVKAIF